MSARELHQINSTCSPMLTNVLHFLADKSVPHLTAQTFDKPAGNAFIIPRCLLITP